MALKWEWENKLGEIELEQNGNKFTLSVYQGNALMIILYEYTDNEGIIVVLLFPIVPHVIDTIGRSLIKPQLRASCQ